MRYYEAAEFLFDLRRFRMRPGTAATGDLLEHLGNPHEGTEFVQVAGSNGKGSTARMLESVLRASGLDVGLYTSPHVDDVRDRVTVNGRPVSKAAVVEFVSAVREYVVGRGAEGTSPTFFEVLTALALWHFGREDVDVAVLEVGIGGRLDATSAVDPEAAAVTSVSLEHTRLLGDTVEEIARDKAHVAPADRPLVTGATGDALAAIRDAVEDVIVVGEGPGSDVTVSPGATTDRLEMPVELAGPDWRVETTIPLLGAHQARNAGVAATLAHQVADVTDDAVARGLRSAHWPGRFEVLGRDPLVVVDGAHNPDACAVLAGTLADLEFDDLHLVFGAMHDKDHAAMADALPEAEEVVVCEPDVDRAEDRDVLAEVFERRGAGSVARLRSVESAVGRALESATADDCVLVTGSLYTVAEARRRWTRTQVRKRVETIDDARAVLEGANVTDAGVWRMRGKAVHRVVKTRVRPRQARYLKEELLSLGGECALSALSGQDQEPIEVVMMGTMAQFKRLIEKLRAQPFGLASVAEDVRESLGIQTEPARRGYPWEDRTAVMGILNVTPDSFHDGGRFDSIEDAVARAEAMVAAGASIVDVGGESTRPGAEPVSPDTERERILPTIERIADLDLDAVISVDTRRAAVAEDALEAGADIVNDVSGLADPEMAHVAAEADAPLVVMHSIDAPVVPGRHVHYDDVVEDVLRELGERVLLAERAGLAREQILVDPGIGFGKAAAESFELLGRVGEFRALGCPVLVGHSQKSMFDAIGTEGDRGAATVAGSAIAAARGADVVRVHDVAENVAAIRAVEAVGDPDLVG